MNKQTAEALEQSIIHWHKNVAAAERGRMRDVQISSRHCALCALFFSNECWGCPVQQKTGRGSCLGSPYDKVAEVVRGFNINLLATDGYAQLHYFCKRELEFLESLREPL